MSDEEKRKRVEDEDEGLSAGRILGLIARRNPELYKRIKKISETTGQKSHELIEEALELLADYYEFSDINQRSLLMAMRFIERMGTWLFTSMNQYLRILASIQAETEETAPAQPTAVKPSSEIREKVLTALLPVLTNLITTLTTTIMSISRPQSTALSQPQSITPSTKINVPIVVEKKSSEENKSSE
jgi:hypothetical protein